jgi:hypothetical protein
MTDIPLNRLTAWLANRERALRERAAMRTPDLQRALNERADECRDLRETLQDPTTLDTLLSEPETA